MAKLSDPKEWTDFSLVRNGRSYENFSSYAELCEAVRHNGLPDFLTQFRLADFDRRNGYVRNGWRNWSAYAYPPAE